MKSLLTFYSIFLFAFSCQKKVDPSICNVKDPLTQLEWLRKITNDTKERQRCDTGVCCAYGVWQASFQGQTVFVFGFNNAANLGNISCDGDSPVYTCEGDSLGVLGSVNVLEVENSTLIWSSR